MDSPSFDSALPQKYNQKRSTYIDFAENQLCPSLISLSPLSSNHPSILQHTRVRSSTLFCNKYINLFKPRSLGFGKSKNDFCTFVHGLPTHLHLHMLAILAILLTHYTKGMPFINFDIEPNLIWCFLSFPSQYFFTIGKKK